MITRTVKQMVQSSPKFVQGAKGVCGSMASGRRFISTGEAKYSDDKFSSKCDTGKCSRLNMDIKGILDRPESNYLQPSKTQQSSRRFVESKPIVRPEIVYEHEQYCREKEECKKIERGDKDTK
ncbi:uncharacterized protein LOC106665903 [Cimex lectularius]|uniref:Uncharacterized protein n=1 Tax=Cimex lectularius TaxID=79782 RepID=A0A8I6TGI8_CIMLE|nr:uncharacterized protein LOC106665903 [Cimex lectularius]